MSENDSPIENLDSPKPSCLRKLLSWKIAIPLLLLVSILFTPMIFRQRRLSQVPDIGDPFAVSEILKPIPEEENAFPLFQNAYKHWKKESSAESEAYLYETFDGWDPTDKLLNKYLNLNRPALNEWRKATEKNNYQLVPIDLVWTSDFPNRVIDNREFIRLTVLEIDRLIKTGKPSEANSWLRASFRFSSLVTKNGSVVDRLVGIAIFAMATNSAEKWMAHPDLTSGKILELLQVIQESVRFMPKPSLTMKMEYLTARHTYQQWSFKEMMENYANASNGPPLNTKFETWLFAEPEFSRRLNAHVIANLLPFLDRSRRERPAILEESLFDESAAGVSLNGRIPAEELVVLLKKSKLIETTSKTNLPHFLEAMDRNQARFACLQVALAAQAFYRDRGEFPKLLSDLQPEYLKSLPEDPYAATPETVIYRRTGNEAVVYSRFGNSIDDGGTTVTFDEARNSGGPNDFGIRINKPHYPPLFALRPKLIATKSKKSSEKIGNPP